MANDNSIGNPDTPPPSLLDTTARGPILKLFGFARTMAINALVISGPDPGAIPGGSTNFFPALSAEAAWGRLASTDV